MSVIPSSMNDEDTTATTRRRLNTPTADRSMTLSDMAAVSSVVESQDNAGVDVEDGSLSFMTGTNLPKVKQPWRYVGYTLTAIGVWNPFRSKCLRYMHLLYFLCLFLICTLGRGLFLHTFFTGRLNHGRYTNLKQLSIYEESGEVISSLFLLVQLLLYRVILGPKLVLLGSTLPRHQNVHIVGTFMAMILWCMLTTSTYYLFMRPWFPWLDFEGNVPETPQYGFHIIRFIETTMYGLMNGLVIPCWWFFCLAQSMCLHRVSRAIRDGRMNIAKARVQYRRLRDWCENASKSFGVALVPLLIQEAALIISQLIDLMKNVDDLESSLKGQASVIIDFTIFLVIVATLIPPAIISGSAVRFANSVSVRCMSTDEQERHEWTQFYQVITSDYTSQNSIVIKFAGVSMTAQFVTKILSTLASAVLIAFRLSSSSKNEEPIL